MWENTTRKTPNTNTFHAVLIAIFQGKVSTIESATLHEYPSTRGSDAYAESEVQTKFSSK